jgi:hypothetical protein
MSKEKISESLRLIRLGNIKVDEFRSSSKEGIIHQAAKMAICQYLQSQGKHFLTEAIFKTGGRADILVLDDIQVIEIIESERPESLVHKRNIYPRGINIIEIHLEKEKSEIFTQVDVGRILWISATEKII